MRYPLAFAISGMLTLAVGLLLIQTRTPVASARKAITGLLILVGAAGILAAGVNSSSGWPMRVAVLGIYSASAGILAAAVGGILLSRGCGTILADLGTGIKGGGTKTMMAIGPALVFLGLTIQTLDPHRATPTILLVGQASFCAGIAARSILLSRVRWAIAERGIVGPDVFIAWKDARGYQWNGDQTLVVNRNARFANARRVTIPVLPGRHAQAATVLAAKLP
jgi:hypothetical protein